MENLFCEKLTKIGTRILGSGQSAYLSWDGVGAGKSLPASPF
jgi:hypothetical protein